MARHRLLRGGGADLVGLRAGAGFRADHGGHVRAAQSDHRHSLWRHRSTRAAGGVEHDPEKWEPVFPRDKRVTRLRGDHAQNESVSMSTVAPAVESARTSGLAAIFEHTR